MNLYFFYLHYVSFPYQGCFPFTNFTFLKLYFSIKPSFIIQFNIVKFIDVIIDVIIGVIDFIDVIDVIDVLYDYSDDYCDGC